MARTLLSAALILCSFSMVGCYTAGPATSVQRINPNETVDLSGNWNDADANQVAEVMIKDCLSRPWAARHRQAKGKDPVLKLYRIRNRSSEIINTKFFTKQVEEELVNSGVVQVVAAWDEAGDARRERTEQSYHASDETKKEHQQETGADYILNGWVASQNDRDGGTSVRAYLITMELVDVEKQRKVWFKSHRIKKVVNQAEAQW